MLCLNFRRFKFRYRASRCDSGCLGCCARSEPGATSLCRENAFLTQLALIANMVMSQIEIHPFLTRPALAAECAARGIAIEAFCPLLRAKRFTHPGLCEIASAVGKSPAQVLLRWSVQKGARCYNWARVVCNFVSRACLYSVNARIHSFAKVKQSHPAG